MPQATSGETSNTCLYQLISRILPFPLIFVFSVCTYSSGIFLSAFEEALFVSILPLELLIPSSFSGSGLGLTPPRLSDDLLGMFAFRSFVSAGKGFFIQLSWFYLQKVCLP